MMSTCVLSISERRRLFRAEDGERLENRGTAGRRRRHGAMRFHGGTSMGTKRPAWSADKVFETPRPSSAKDRLGPGGGRRAPGSSRPGPAWLFMRPAMHRDLTPAGLRPAGDPRAPAPVKAGNGGDAGRAPRGRSVSASRRVERGCRTRRRRRRAARGGAACLLSARRAISSSEGFCAGWRRHLCLSDGLAQDGVERRGGGRQRMLGEHAGAGIVRQTPAFRGASSMQGRDCRAA
jgi:hypothetical protein